MTDLPLFREQAIRYQSDKLYGTIVLTRHWSYAALTIFFSAIAVVIIIFFLVAGYTRRENVAGVITPSAGLVRVAAPHESIVKVMRFTVGDEVKAGDVLFILSEERESRSGGTQQAINKSLLSRIEKLRDEIASQQRLAQNALRNTAQRIAELHGELTQIDREIALVKQRAQLSREEANRFAELQKQHFVSRLQTEEKLTLALDQETRLHELHRAKINLQRDLTAQEAERDDIPLRSTRETSELEREIATVQQDLAENDANRELIIRAPRAGRITAIFAESDQTVAARQPLLALLPQGSVLEAQLFVPSRAIGFVRVGDDVLLRYAAFPYEKFGQKHGVVREISRSTLSKHDIALAGAGSSQATGTNEAEPVYRLRVKLDEDSIVAFGKPQPLQPGMELQASLLLEHRKLYEWILGPLYELKRQLR